MEIPRFTGKATCDYEGNEKVSKELSEQYAEQSMPEQESLPHHDKYHDEQCNGYHKLHRLHRLQRVR